jgi:hypothetical protein
MFEGAHVPDDRNQVLAENATKTWGGSSLAPE